jgi:hypothetical protein
MSATPPRASLALRPTPRQIFLDKYQFVVSIIVTFLFFADLPEYFDRTGLIPINALQTIIISCVLALPFVKKLRDMPWPVTAWLVMYLIFNLIWLAIFPVDETVMQYFRMRVLTVVYIPLMYVLFHQKSLRHIQIVIIVVGLMSVFNCCLQLISPEIFLVTEKESPRPAGFYVNPTKTGAALILAMIFGIDIIRQKFRIPYMLILGLGIVVTFSRSGMITWLICFLIYIFTRVATDKPRRLLIWLVTVATIFTVANPLPLIIEPLADAGLVSYSVKGRLEWTQDASKSEGDESANERKDVARLGWLTYTNHPFLGTGIASTYKWEARVSTHNMYLYMMAEHGITGVLVFLLMIAAPLYQNRGINLAMKSSFVAFMLVISFFSHNVMEERYLIMSIALLAAMNTNGNIYGSFDIMQSIPSRLFLPHRQRFKKRG